MAEVEIHAGHHEIDAFGKRVGILVGMLGIALAAVTIGAHRAHTAAVMSRTEANDQWSFYQAKKEREHLLEVSALLAENLSNEPARVQGMVAKFRSDRERYLAEAQQIQREARALEAECLHQELRALRLDMSEGFLELGLVLSSLYFLAQRRFFPALGGSAGVLGLLLACWGFLS
ncbi:MAG: DUF4337 domain-containing protein [Proteobacteria bacterium]|nr:DUF4337 domain-containing protein [Pseudomonadota bacterium]